MVRIVRDRDRGNTLKDLVEIGDEVTVAQGGRGGRGNKAFASATNRTPREFEPGGEGEERWVSLELKVIADAGLIGFPNAGKSTLLSRLSRATPEIADYPFTTKHPNLGIVSLGGDAAFVLADLPGLILGDRVVALQGDCQLPTAEGVALAAGVGGAEALHRHRPGEPGDDGVEHEGLRLPPAVGVLGAVVVVVAQREAEVAGAQGPDLRQRRADVVPGAHGRATAHVARFDQVVVRERVCGVGRRSRRRQPGGRDQQSQRDSPAAPPRRHGLRAQVHETPSSFSTTPGCVAAQPQNGCNSWCGCEDSTSQSFRMSSFKYWKCSSADTGEAVAELATLTIKFSEQEVPG